MYLSKFFFCRQSLTKESVKIHLLAALLKNHLIFAFRDLGFTFRRNKGVLIFFAFACFFAFVCFFAFFALKSFIHC